MTKLIFAVLPALAGCMSVPPVATPAAAYHGVGTEPFWNLAIDARSITVTRPETPPVVQPRPAVIVGIAGEIYKTPRIDVNIVHAQCSDGMSDRVYPDKVQLTVDGTRYDGCGGL